MTNVKKPAEVITTPKTGDDSKVGLWIALSAAAAAGCAAFGFFAGHYGKKKEEE